MGAAKVVLVLIGPDWLATLNERAGKPDVDYVRHEVEAALQRHAAGNGMRVVPVLFGGTAMPSAPQFAPALQASLSALCALDAHEFRGKQADWDQQFVRLREHVAEVIGVPARFRTPAGTEQVFRVIDQAISPHFQDPNGLLGRLRETLCASGSAAVVARAALYGMGGLGKTQLALKYSHDFRDHYAGVWWFRAETETTMQVDAGDACKAVLAPVRASASSTCPQPSPRSLVDFRFSPCVRVLA